MLKTVSSFGDSLGLIALLFVLIKVLQWAIIVLVPGQFDTSSHLLQDSTNLLHWDGVYLYDMMVNGIRWEHQYVFFPFYWRFCRWIKEAYPHVSPMTIPIIISNVCHFATCISVYFLTKRVFNTSSMYKGKADSLAKFTALLYVVSPSGVFLSNGYLESLCNFLSITLMLLREIGLDYRSFDNLKSNKAIKYTIAYFVLGTLLAINFGVRSNTALVGVLYLWDLIDFIWKNGNWRDSIIAIATGSQLAISILGFNIYNYYQFCPQRGEWCQWTVPLLFSYAQSKYWGVGFLKYWTPNNIPNFLFAAPLLVLCWFSHRYFIDVKPMRTIIPYVFMNNILALGSLLLWHTQIYNRISSFIPVTYWFVADILQLTRLEERKMAQWIIGYFIGWNLLQTGLFSAFLPPA